jgi:hypothetical protein
MNFFSEPTREIGWKHIILGFLALGLLMLVPASCTLAEHEERIHALEENRQTYLILDMDTMVSENGDTTIYETRIYAPNSPVKQLRNRWR